MLANSLGSSIGVVAPAAQSDTVSLVIPYKAIRVTAAGNVKIKDARGTDAVCAFAAGETRYITATRIYATLTTATGIEGML